MGKKVNRSSKALAKNVEQFLATLPSEYLLIFTKNRIQELYWLAHRNNAKLLGECLSVRFARKGGNPARRRWLDGEITQQDYEFVNAKVDMWDLFYDLLQLCWNDMKQFNKESDGFPFDSEQQMLFTIFSDHYNASFLKCLKPYSLNSTVNNEKAIKILRQSLWQNKPLTPEQGREVDKLIGDLPTNFWFGYAIEFFSYLGNQDPVVNKKLKDFSKTCAEGADLSTQEATRQRKAKDCPTYAWREHELFIAQKGSRYIGYADWLTQP